MAAGQVAKILHQHLAVGRMVLNIPVETSDSIVVVNVSWNSEAKMKTLRTEPAWNAAPDISVQILSATLPEEIAGSRIIPLMRAAAREVWILHYDGHLVSHKQQDFDFMLNDIPNNINTYISI
jgi:hypothetical protein